MPPDDIGYLLNRATRQFRLQLAEALSNLALRPQQAAALLAIAHSRDGRLTPQAIAEAIATDAATTSGLIERMSRDGWLASQPNPEDGRSRLMVLTEKATAALPNVRTAAESVSARATSGLSPEEIAVLANLLARIGQDERTTPGEEGDSR